MTALIRRLIFLALFSPIAAVAYPNFIGYGYTTCVTCHYNTLGHGPLNDYGRALFAQEIAARPFIPETVSDEELGDKSGVIPGKELPVWIRPGLKYRGLWYQTNPGGKDAISKYLHMQREVNLAVQSDANATYLLILTYDFLPDPQNYYGQCDGGGNCVQGIFREQYVKWRASKNLQIAAGLMDKAYGLRIVDHTAFSRSGIGLGQFDQTHGLLLHWMEANWDLAAQYHAGDLNFPSDQRQRGFSATGESTIGEKHRLGASLLSTESDGAAWKRFAVHDRWGLAGSPGSSLMWELGLMQNRDKTTDTTASGTYGLVELMVHLTRGYNLLSTIERSQAEVKSTVPERSRWSLGVLTFPFPRTEFRAGLVNSKNYSIDTSSADGWQLQGQIHVSL